jgi:hypothetical protein
MRGGKLNNTEFGRRMGADGHHAEAIHNLFRLGKRRAGIESGGPGLSSSSFRRPGQVQLRLFD